MGFKSGKIGAYIFGGALYLDVYSLLSVHSTTHTGVTLSYLGQTISKGSYESTLTTVRGQVIYKTVIDISVIEAAAGGISSAKQSLDVTIHFTDSQSLTESIQFSELVPIDVVKTKNNFHPSDLQTSFTVTAPEKPGDMYNYNLQIERLSGNFRRENYLYYGADTTEYVVYNSTTSLFSIDSRSLDATSKKYQFGVKPLSTGVHKFIGSIGLRDDKFDDGTTLQLVFVHGPDPDLHLEFLKVCMDPTSSSYYKSSPFEICGGSFDNFADQAAANIAHVQYNLISTPDCCKHDAHGGLTGEGDITTSPDEFDADAGSITYTWEGGQGPYDLVFVCPPEDATCISAYGTSYTVTDTSALTFVFSGLSGTEDATTNYSLSVTDNTGAVVNLLVSTLLTAQAALNLRCNTTTAINYLAGGTSTPTTCRWCDAASGTIKNTIGASDGGGVYNPVLLHTDNVFGTELSSSSSYVSLSVATSHLFDVQVKSVNPTTTTAAFSNNNTGKFYIRVKIKNIDLDSEYDAGYNFLLGTAASSPQIDGSGGFIKLERKTLYTTNAGRQAYDSLSNDIQDGDAEWDLGSAEATPTTKAYVDADYTPYAIEGLVANLPAGKYMYKLSYTDTNSNYSSNSGIENCYVYYQHVIQRAGCTEPLAPEYVGDDLMNSGLIQSTVGNNNAFCTDPVAEVDITDPALYNDLFNFNLAASNSEYQPDCEFDMYMTFQSQNLTNISFTSAIEGQSFNLHAGMTHMQDVILHMVAYNVYGLSYIPLGVQIFEATYYTTYYSISPTGTQIQHDIIATTTSNSGAYATNFQIAASTSNYNFEETTAFGTNISTAAVQVGTQSMFIDFEIYINDTSQGLISINMMPEGPQVFSILEIAAMEGGSGSISDFISGGVLCQDCESAFDLVVEGCTDIQACNWNAGATVDDGSCAGYFNGTGDNGQIVAGGNWWSEALQQYGTPCACIDENYLEYNPIAADWASQYNNNVEVFPIGSVSTACITPHVLGCTDPSALGYNPLATQEDGTCGDYATFGCTDSTACNYNPEANTDDGSCAFEPGTNDCVDFDNWEFTTVDPPETCSGSDTNSGTFIISNLTYSGPLSIRLAANSDDFVGAFEETVVNFQLSGVNNSTGLSTIVDQGSFITESGISNGVAISATQSAAGGTTITFINVAAYTYTIYIIPGIQDQIVGTYNGGCNCILGDITNPNNLAPGVLTIPSQEGTGIGFNFILGASFGRAAGAGNCGCCDESSGTYDSSIDPVNGEGVCNQNLCADYGCTDPEANNYNPDASLPCTSPSNQNGAGGVQCKPCNYGYVSSIYTPAFCMPSKTRQQLEIIRKCIGTAGTNAFINVITGKSDCTTKDAWKLILIEYLMGKEGLDCVYNCADASTPNVEELETCSKKAENNYHIVEHLSRNLYFGTRTYYVGSTYKFSYTQAEANVQTWRYYTLMHLPDSDEPNINFTHITVYPYDHSIYDGQSAADLFYYKYAPLAWEGWKLCEEPPKKVTTKDYIGKFVNFVQNYCRQCQIPVTAGQSESTTEIESVITVNGIVITVNNSNIR